MAIIIPQSSARKVALLCAEANSLRNTIGSLGSSALKFDSAIQNTLNTIIDVCNQFNKAVELAETAGDLILKTVNGLTATATNAKSVINQGVTKLPSLPLGVSTQIDSILNQVLNVEFEQINTDLLFSQITQFAPAGFTDVLKQVNRIPETLRTPADNAVNALAKGIDFNSILASTTTAIQKKSITCIMAGSKEKLANTNSLLAQETQNILKDVNDNIKEVAPSPIASEIGSGNLNGIPFSVDEIPGLNADGLNLFTLAANLTGVSSAIFYIEMACEIAKIANTTISTVNDLVDRFQNIMPTDSQLNARLDKAVRNQLNQFLKDLTGLSISDLEQLKEECSALVG